MSETQTKPQAPAVAGAAPAALPALASPFSSMAAFADAQRIARALASSDLVPTQYKGDAGLGNCLIALELAQRIGISPLAVMQHGNVIHGRFSWSSQFLVAAINTCGKFSPLRFRFKDLGPAKIEVFFWAGPKDNRRKEKKVVELAQDRECIAHAIERETGEVLSSPPVSLGMAVREGWFDRDGSKWQTMPELMLTYRAAAFFSRIYAPEVGMGMHTADEVEDFAPVERVVNPEAPPAPPAGPKGAAAEMNEKIKTKKKDAPPAAPPAADAKPPEAASGGQPPAPAAPPAATSAEPESRQGEGTGKAEETQPQGPPGGGSAGSGSEFF